LGRKANIHISLYGLGLYYLLLYYRDYLGTAKYPPAV